MNFPTTTEEFLKTLAHGKEPTSEDREYAEALGKLSELNYWAGYEAGANKKSVCLHIFDMSFVQIYKLLDFVQIPVLH